MKKILLSVLLCAPLAFAGRIVVGAAVPDLASIAASVGGDRVETFSVAKADNNPHTVEVLPSHMVRVARAKLYVKNGLALDGWSDGIVAGARNRELLVVDASAGVPVLEKPSGKVDASMGDVHPDGNPHYLLDPANGLLAARNIELALEKVDPAGAAAYRANLTRFEAELKRREEGWKSRMAVFTGSPVFTYHSSWAYFAHAFGLSIVGKVEPVPGIPPNARHLADLTAIAKERKVGILLQETYFPKDAGQFLQRQAGVRPVTASPMCKGAAAGDYLDHFDQLVGLLAGVR